MNRRPMEFLVGWLKLSIAISDPPSPRGWLFIAHTLLGKFVSDTPMERPPTFRFGPPFRLEDEEEVYSSSLAGGDGPPKVSTIAAYPGHS